MAAIQCCELRFVEPLDYRQHRRIDKANVCVGVLIAALAHPPVVLRHEVFYLICPGDNIVEKRH